MPGGGPGPCKIARKGCKSLRPHGRLQAAATGCWGGSGNGEESGHPAFIQNLLEVEARLAVEHDQTVAWERKVREELGLAQSEAKKMASLCERAKAQADEAAQRREQGQMDAAALSQFHLRAARP